MKKKKNDIPAPSQRKKSTRTNRITIALNNEEKKALERFVVTYKISNQSRWIRETLMTSILRKFDEDHPTLF